MTDYIKLYEPVAALGRQILELLEADRPEATAEQVLIQMLALQCVLESTAMTVDQQGLRVAWIRELFEKYGRAPWPSAGA